MINKNLFNERYEAFIPKGDTQTFIKDLDKIKTSLNFELINTLKPLLIYSINKRNEIYYLLGFNYSLQKRKVLNYTVITGATFTRQHFADADKDMELHDNIYYGDLLFISLSQNDYMSEYMENLLIDLIEFRNNRNKLTVITYDVVNSAKNHIVQTKKLNDHFASSKYSIIDTITNKSAITSKHSETTQKTVKPKQNRRIV